MTTLAILDLDTATHTAFDTWGDFVDACRRGFCPTLRGTGDGIARMRAWLHAEGYPYFDGLRVVYPPE